MAFSTQRVTSDGTLDQLDLSIDYLSRDDIGVFFDNVPAPDAEWDWVGETDSTIAFTPDVPLGVEVLIQRSTKLDNLIHIFTQGAAFNNATMDEDFLQLLFLVQESVEGSGITDVFNNVNYHGFRITNLGTAIDPSDAVSLGQATAATAANAAAAALSETAAAVSASLADSWARYMLGPVEGLDYSAKYYASIAQSVVDAAIQASEPNTFTALQTFEVAPAFPVLTASRALGLNSSGELASSSATTTELSYLSGVTSAIQTQLNGKQATITGAATTIDTENLTASRALVSDASGKIVVSAVTAAELAFMDGVTVNVQTQLNAKADLSDAWPGQYTGSNGNTLAFPVGSIIAVYDGNSINRAGNDALYLGADARMYDQTVSGTALTGTWRSRGLLGGGGSIGGLIFQRTA